MVALFWLNKQLSEEQLLLAVAATSINFDLSIIDPLFTHLQMLHGKFPFWEGVVVWQRSFLAIMLQYPCKEEHILHTI